MANSQINIQTGDREDVAKIWNFHRGEWTTIRDPMRHDWEEKLEDALERFGYNPHLDWIGSEDGFSYVIVEREEQTEQNAPWQYVVWVYRKSAWRQTIWVTDFPSLLTLARDLAALG